MSVTVSAKESGEFDHQLLFASITFFYSAQNIWQVVYTVVQNLYVCLFGGVWTLNHPTFYVMRVL